MSIALRTGAMRRRPGLTPLIDVVFLLLIFFMLASSFDSEVAIDIGQAGGGAGYEGPPRLIDVSPDAMQLNGIPVSEALLSDELAPLMPSPDAVIVLRATNGADVQRMIDVLQRLQALGYLSAAIVP